MTGHAVRPAVVLALLVAALLTGCQASPSPSSPSGSAATASTPPCSQLADRIVAAVQAYVDSFADVRPADIPGAVSARQGDFRATTAALAEQAQSLKCETSVLADEVRRGLAGVKGGTPVQDAIVDTFRADPLGSIDPSDAGASTVRVRTAQELVAAVTHVGAGSTIILAAGTYALRSPLVTLRPVTLRGAGDGTDPRRATTTTITSTASGAAILASTGGDLVLTDLAVEHTGSAVASVVIVAAGGYRFERVRLSGGTAKDGAGGFGVILRPSSGPLVRGGSDHALTNLRLDKNAGGGIVIAGTERPVISGVTVSASTGCGLCWVENSGGTARDVTVTGGDIGVRIENGASVNLSTAKVTDAKVGLLLNGSGASRVENSEVSGGTVGVQSAGSATLNLVNSRVTGAREIGLRLSGSTRTTLERMRLSGTTKIGVATVGQAASTLTGGEVSSTGEVGLVWGDEALGTVVDLVLRGPKLGVQLGASATLVATRLVVDRSPAAAVLAGGKSSGVLTRLTCGTGAGAAVVFTQSTGVRLQDSPGCRGVRQ